MATNSLTSAETNFGIRFTTLLNNSRFKGNLSAFEKAFNNGKRYPRARFFKTGANPKYRNMVKIAMTFHIHTFELIDFMGPIPKFDFIDRRKLDKRIAEEYSHFLRRVNEIKKKNKITFLDIETSNDNTIDSSNILKYFKGKRSLELITQEKIAIGLTCEIVDFHRD